MNTFPVELKPGILKKAFELEIFSNDIEEKFIRGSGHGGQKVNKTSSTVWLKHIPTGVEVKCQSYREQSKNRIAAYKLLIYKIDALKKGRESERAKKIFKLKKQKIKRSKRAKEKLLALKKHRKEIKEARKSIDF
ncbi:peptide chain release factor-like protein [Candidatus Peregrinibacteria bacterium]|nr:peptide chain release factor-like protein [Candidatus Peregrinibacteria bacterium]